MGRALLRTDGWAGGQAGRRADRWTDRQISIVSFQKPVHFSMLNHSKRYTWVQSTTDKKYPGENHAYMICVSFGGGNVCAD